MTVAYDKFADIYDRWVSSGGPVMDACREFYVRHMCATEGPVVELGVGNGRILLEAAKRGKAKCIGVDYSQGMLELCRRKANEAGVASRVRLVQGDMRDVRLPEPVALVTIPYDSIGHAVTEADKLACFRNVFAQLVPGGRFILDQQIYAPAMLERYDRTVRLRDAFVDPVTKLETCIFHTTMQNMAERSWRSFLWIETQDADGLVTRRSLGSVDNSWITPDDMRRLLLDAGFEVEAHLGSYAGAPFEEGATHQIWVLKRPA